MSVDDVIRGLTGQAGVIILFVIIIWAGYKGYWVFGWYAKELRDRNNKMESRLDKAVGISESATEIAQQQISKSTNNGNEVRHG